MQVYSPFIAINKTGFPINLKSGNNKMLAGQSGNGTLLRQVSVSTAHARLTSPAALSESTPFSKPHVSTLR